MISPRQVLKATFERYPGVKKTAERLIATVPLSTRLGREFWSWYAFFEESEQWSARQLADYQFDCLRALLSTLLQTSRFYQQRLASLDVQSLNTLQQFQAQVPVLSREQFRENHSDILSSVWKQLRVAKSQTSGTTGMALQFYHLAQDHAREWAAICHQWQRVGYIPGESYRAEFRGLTSPGKLVEVFPSMNMLRCSILNMKTQHVRYYAEEIRKHQRITFYHGYPSALYLLAREISNSDIDFPQPQAILLASEVVYGWQLSQIRAAFPNSKLFAHYGCAERTVLGGWCEHRQEYHILPQYSIVEVDETTSEIVGTNLFNTVNGFVRYCMTDTVLKVEQKPCPDCGRPYIPRLVKLGGRSEDYLYSPQNGWIPPAIITYPLKALNVIQEIQFYQKERGKIIIRYTVIPQSDPLHLEAELSHIETDLHHLFGKSMRFYPEQVEGFERSRSGKFKWIICELEEKPSRQNRTS
jgi:phenylacetate-CoA ligase